MHNNVIQTRFPLKCRAYEPVEHVVEDNEIYQNNFNRLFENSHTIKDPKESDGKHTEDTEISSLLSDIGDPAKYDINIEKLKVGEIKQGDILLKAIYAEALLNNVKNKIQTSDSSVFPDPPENETIEESFSRVKRIDTIKDISDCPKIQYYDNVDIFHR